MVSRFIEFFTNEGDVVLDPFAGIGSTLVACKILKRNGIGIEVNKKYLKLAEEKTNQAEESKGNKQHLVLGDARETDVLLRELLGKDRIDFCVTSPPYWDMLHKSRGGSRSMHKERKEKGLPLVYSKHKDDLGNIADYEEYLNVLVLVFFKVFKVLKSGGYLVVILQNIRDKDGTYKTLAWDLAKKLGSFYEIKQEQIWCQSNKRTGIWGFPTTYISNTHHHYCLVFMKPKDRN